MATEAHPFRRPSRMGLLSDCPPSERLYLELVKRGVLKPDDSTPEAVRGWRLHEEIKARIIAGMVGDLSAEDESQVALCMEFFHRHLVGGEVLSIEQPLACTISGVEHEDFCKPDLVIGFPDQLLVIDWKMGFADLAERHVAWQLELYQLAAWQEFGGPTITAVKALAYQPWQRREFMAIRELSGFHVIEDNVELVFREADVPEGVFNPGPDQCRYCPCLPHCEVAQTSALGTAVSVATRIDNGLASPRQNRKDYERVKAAMHALETWLKFFEDQFRAGTCSMEGYEILERQGNRKIVAPDALFRRLRMNGKLAEEGGAEKFIRAGSWSLTTVREVAEVTDKELSRIAGDAIAHGPAVKQIVKAKEVTSGA